MAKILLVEDNEMNRDMLSRRLKKRGYEVEIAVDGAEGVDKARAGSPELILMDMSLPVKDGWEAISEITGALGTKRPFLISHSAGILEDDAVRARRKGAHAHLPKPARPEQVHETLRAAMRHEGVEVGG